MSQIDASGSSPPWMLAPVLDALTITFVHFAGEGGELFRRTGHGFHILSPMTAVAALDMVAGFDPDLEPVLYDRLGAWAVLFAPNGYELSLPDTVARLSSLGKVISAFWNVNAVMRVLVAEDGVVSRSFDPLLFEDSEGKPLPEEEGLAFGITGPELRLNVLQLLERVTGERLSREWFMELHQAYMLHR